MFSSQHYSTSESGKIFSLGPFWLIWKFRLFHIHINIEKSFNLFYCYFDVFDYSENWEVWWARTNYRCIRYNDNHIVINGANFVPLYSNCNVPFHYSIYYWCNAANCAFWLKAHWVEMFAVSNAPIFTFTPLWRVIRFFYSAHFDRFGNLDSCLNK